MQEEQANRSEFLDQARAIIQDHISEEQFGVSELAEALCMSRSNLLRRIKKHTELSASQFIRQVRLERGMELLDNQELTVSEIAYQVGFGSTSYFVKCFHDHYGYSPGTAGKRGTEGQTDRRHQLVAIMFTDIEGYTALMQKDEEKAVRFRDRHREVFNSITKKYKGRILQYYGDGTLSTFPSAIDAVRCSVEMQHALRQDPQIPVRIGIHTGDIITTDDDIIGDGVNIASRIESMSVSGGIYVSEKVYDEIKNQSDITTVSLGQFTFKNVEKPIEVFAITNEGLAFPRPDQAKKEATRSGTRLTRLQWVFMLVLATLLLYVLADYADISFADPVSPDESVLQAFQNKSIAVLPFKNESMDSSNIYFVNGLMESTLSNLQKIEDLRVISRTSVEKYRNTDKSIPEIASELNVSYFVEGSGQKVGNQVLLNIQLIEASTDRHIWAEQYNRRIEDIFSLQNEIARQITDAIQVIVTPAEREQIEKKPTDNLQAYDYYLQALDGFFSRTEEGLNTAIPLLEKAIELDPEFSLAYADLAIAYYFLDVSRVEKQYTDEINTYADQALLYDSKSDVSLIAKAFYYLHMKEYRLALPHLEKALEYNPNSSSAIQMLTDYYARIVPNTAKYLEYALQGIQLEIAANDSVTRSYIYLQLANAFVQSGFVDEAVDYIERSIAFGPQNYYSPYVRAYILYARDRDLVQTRNLLITEWKKDTTRLDILQEVAKIYFYERNFDRAYFYYKKFVREKELRGLSIYPQEDIKIGYTYEQVGLMEEARRFYDSYAAYCERDESIYKSASMAMRFIQEDRYDEAIEQLREFSGQDNFQYWILLFMENDPILEPLKEHPEFDEVFQKIQDRFWQNQATLKESLEAQGLI